MDFWARLLKNPLGSSGSPKDLAKDPQKRLHRFEKEYTHLLNRWRASSNLMLDTEAAEALEIRLQELTNILSDESRRPLPHPCIQYASIKQIYVPIGKIATTSQNEWIIKEAVLLFATLVESEEEAFVENPAFSASLTNLLVRITGVNSVRLGLDTESRVVELAFNITTKIRLEPEILPAWFKSTAANSREHHRLSRQLNYPQRQVSTDRSGRSQSREDFAGRTQKADFPLFYILIDYIHHEGKVGDFARTGLLYIIEAASSSALLEQWIVESDLATLMATGLGALYSQLSRKLVIDHLPHDLPPILALSDYEHPASDYEIISSCSPSFQSHLETFLSHLLFWQDVLNHCRSVEVKSTMLEHFQVIFLQQLLYPSLLESSDIDGGSSVAVLTYLRRILESLDHPDMINLILHYLLGLPDQFSSNGSHGPRTTISDARKRKSMDLANMLAETSDPTAATPLLFNLVDLILACLRSKNQQTIHVTLQLVSSILRRHHRYAVTTLLRTDAPPSRAHRRTIGAHEQEIDYLMSLAGYIGGHGNFDEAYENAIKDNMARLESHPCSLKLVAPKVSVNNHKLPEIPDSLPGAPRDVREHTLRCDDPLLNTVLDLLETFFVNPVETNLSVTETIVDLAVCGYMSIEGWLARSPKHYTYAELDQENEEHTEEEATEGKDDDSLDEEAEKVKAMAKCRQRPEWTQSSLPRVLSVLQRLTDQVTKYKEQVPRFEELVQQRREAFQTADAVLSNRPSAARDRYEPERPSMDESNRSGSPSRPSALEGFAQRLLSELGTPSRSSSPRGRRSELSRTSGSGVSSPAPMKVPSPRAVPKEPIGGYPRSYSPTSNRDDVSNDGREAMVSSAGMATNEATAFAAVDQSILSRKVGLPVDQETLAPIPLSFDKKPMPEPVEAEEEAQAQTEKVEEESRGEPAENPGAEGQSDEAAVEPAAEGDQAAETPAASEARGEDATTETDERAAERTQPGPAQGAEDLVSVSHVITNVIILQSFLFELASLLQVRAGLFDEVRFV